MFSAFIYLLSFVLQSSMWSVQWGRFQDVLEKDGISAVAEWNVLYMFVRYSHSTVLYKCSVSLLIFWFPCAGKTQVVKSDTNVVLLSISIFTSVKIFIFRGTLMLDIYIFVIVVFSW